MGGGGDGNCSWPPCWEKLGCIIHLAFCRSVQFKCRWENMIKTSFLSSAFKKIKLYPYQRGGGGSIAFVEMLGKYTSGHKGVDIRGLLWVLWANVFMCALGTNGLILDTGAGH